MCRTSRAIFELKGDTVMGKKSELDFLEEFEKELDLGDDTYDDFLSQYEDEFFNLEDDMDIAPRKEAEKKETSLKEEKSMETPKEEPKEKPSVASQNSMDIDALIGGASEIMGTAEKPTSKAQVEEPISFSPQSEEASAMEAFGGFSFDDMPADMNFDVEIPLADAGTAGGSDAFADFFSTQDTAPVEEIPAPPPPGSEVIDLSNLGEEDLMSLLAGEDAFSDLGSMLSQSESGQPIEEVDAFAAFAENEMSIADLANEAEKAADGKDGKEKKKNGFFAKLASILFGNDDDEEDEIIFGKKKGGPNASQLSGENADILASMEEEEKGGKKKKEKKKKEKKKKEPKPKKEKAPKPPKEKKPKKEKPPKEVDKTPPLPKKPVILIWVMAISLFVLIYIAPGLVSYSFAVSNAKSLSDNGEYAEAYKELFGITIKEKDMELYNQVATLAPADSELHAYEVFLKNNWQLEALDSLICAAGRCELNEDNADLYACAGQMQVLKSEITNKLRDKYGMTYEDALELYHAKNRDMYTVALHGKLKELGLEE